MYVKQYLTFCRNVKYFVNFKYFVNVSRHIVTLKYLNLIASKQHGDSYPAEELIFY